MKKPAVPGTPAAVGLPLDQRQQRGERRMPHRAPCRVRLVEPKTGVVRTVAGETVNLSPSGIAVQVGVEVPVGTWVETLLPHADGDTLFLRGRVVHVRRTMHAHYELGVAMSDDSPRWLG